MKHLWAIITAWFAPRSLLRRYRVAPRKPPVAFRRDLLQGIQLELRRTGLLVSPRSLGRTTL